MKLTKKLLAILLTAVMLIGIFPVAANAAGNTVLANGSSDYSILLPNGASEELQFAASELNTFLQEIAGVTLPIVYDTNGADTNGKWISIGNTSLFRASGNTASGLKGEASRVKTYNNSILLFGGSEAGTTFAVYDLLERWFSLKFYTPDCYTYTAKTSVSFETLDLTKAPAVDYRTVGRYFTYFTPLQQVRRMRGSQIGDYMDALGHSYFSLMPPEQYFASHPEWYSNYDPATSNAQAGWQLCLSNSAMRAQLLANVKAKLARDKANGLSYKYFAICQNDGDGFCTCSNCRSLNLQYSGSSSSYSGAQLALLNEIAAACKDEYPDVIFYMLAYTNYTDQAPTKNITAASNVGVMLAPIDCQSTDSYFGNYGTSAYNNGRVTNNINKWSAICSHLMMWGYAAQFADYMCPTNTFDSLAANAQGYADKGFEVIFNQAHGTVLPYFETMKNYLECKAFYDGSINTSTEITNYINNYYGAASSAISNYYTAFMNNMHAFENGYDKASFAAGQYLDGPLYYSPVIKSENYSKSYADTCKGYFDSAYAALANTYGAGTEAYNTYKKRVDLEYLGVLYIYLQLYRSSLSNEQGAAMTQQAIDIISENNVGAISKSAITTWINAFGVVTDGIAFYDFEPTNPSFSCDFLPFNGEVDGVSFSGVKMSAGSYQPHFKLTASGVQNLQAYCTANGYDTVRIHCYADLTNNGFIMGGNWYGKAWSYQDVEVADLTESYDFWSQSESLSTIYLWFEYFKAPAITANSFTGSVSFAEYSGTVAGVSFDGFRGASSSYQPHFHFTQAAVDKIKAYANEIDASEMIIHAYANLYNNSFVMGGDYFGPGNWYSKKVKVSDLTTSFDFWSQSEGATEVYLWFEFPAKVGGRTTVAGTGWSFENFSGTVGGETFEGIRGTSSAYQPHFTFTEEGLARLNAYAAENGFDTLIIHSYANLYNNALVLDNQQWVGAEWKTLEIPLADLSTSFDFWSQSEGLSEVYLWFDFTTSELINRTSFSGSGWNFQNYSGTVDGKTFDGVRGTSGAYQPDFYFTASAVEAIKAYAAENNFETLRISSYAIQLDNGFVVNGGWTPLNSWSTTDVKISDLSTSFRFWSQSQGSSEVYLTFEFLAHVHSYTSTTVDATCTKPGSVTYTCACGDTYTEPIAALGHDIISDAAVPATCTQTGLTAGQHCSRCDYAVAQNTVPALGHDYIYTDNGANHTVTCSRCDYSQTQSHAYTEGVCVCGAEQSVEFKITSASLKLNEDINLIYAVSVPAGYTNVYMVFDYMGSSFKVTDYTVNEKGEYCFTFAKVVPQCMCENVSATAYATVNGEKTSFTVAEYSVKTYCANMLAKNPTAALKTLLSDLLTYGAATQQYLGYKTNALATDGLTLTPGSYGTPTGAPVAFTGEKSTAADWKSAALGLSNALALRFTFAAESTSGLTVEITVDGRTKTFTADDFTAIGSGLYTVTFRDIKATEFGTTVTARFYKNGSPVGRTISYSVNTYISAFGNTDSTAFAQLLQALYNYGKSAEAYKQ